MDKHPNMECLLIATSFSMSSNDICNIFTSSIFPPSNSLSDIITLLFSPYVILKLVVTAFTSWCYNKIIFQLIIYFNYITLLLNFRCNSTQTQYTGAMCGIGWQKVGDNIFPSLAEFDIKLSFKEKFEDEDIKEVI